MGAMSDYLENHLLDFVLRAQTYTAPTTTYVALFTATPSDSGGGTEVSGGGYARVAVTSGLTEWAGTQSAASTTASTGTSGTTSNNNVLTFPSPTANWGLITSFGLFDASTSGNLLIYGTLSISKNVNNGDAPPSFAAAALSWQIDS